MVAIVQILLRILKLGTIVTFIVAIIILIVVTTGIAVRNRFTLLTLLLPDWLQLFLFDLCRDFDILLSPLLKSLVPQLLLESVILLCPHLSVLSEHRPTLVSQL